MAISKIKIIPSDIWCNNNSSEIIKPNNQKLEEGWQYGEKPPHSTFNWYQNTMSQNMVHIMENGVPEWDNSTDYNKGALTKYNNKIYIAIHTTAHNINKNPGTATTYWKDYVQYMNENELGGREWNSELSYMIGDIVSYDHYVFISKTNNNTNHTPDTSGSNAYWERYSGLGGLQPDQFVRSDIEDDKSGHLNMTSGSFISFENQHHWITNNDGGGNFNIRAGCTPESNTKYTENGHGAILATFNHESPNPRFIIKLSENASSKSAGDDVVWEKTFSIEKNGILNWNGIANFDDSVNVKYNTSSKLNLQDSSSNNRFYMEFTGTSGDIGFNDTNGNLLSKINLSDSLISLMNITHIYNELQIEKSSEGAMKIATDTNFANSQFVPRNSADNGWDNGNKLTAKRDNGDRFWVFDRTPRVNLNNKYQIWHEGNDGSGSGLDADKVDGLQADQFVRSDVEDNKTGHLNMNGGSFISFENGKHWITNNDGAGNFNIRIGHKYDTDTGALVVTEDGYTGGITFNQPNGYFDIIQSTSSENTDDISDVDTSFRFYPNGKIESIRGNYSLYHYSNASYTGTRLEDSFAKIETKTPLLIGGVGNFKQINMYNTNNDPDNFVVRAKSSSEAIDVSDKYTVITKGYLKDSTSLVTEFYVDNVNGDDNNDGRTSSTPVKTLHKAIDLCSPLTVNKIYLMSNIALNVSDGNGNYNGLKIKGLKVQIVSDNPSGSTSDNRLTLSINENPQNYVGQSCIYLSHAAELQISVDLTIKNTSGDNIIYNAITSLFSTINFALKRNGSNKYPVYIYQDTYTRIANVNNSSFVLKQAKIRVNDNYTSGSGGTNTEWVRVAGAGNDYTFYLSNLGVYCTRRYNNESSFTNVTQQMVKDNTSGMIYSSSNGNILNLQTNITKF